MLVIKGPTGKTILKVKYKPDLTINLCSCCTRKAERERGADMKKRRATDVINALYGTKAGTVVAKDVVTGNLVSKDENGMLINRKTGYPAEFNLHHMFIFLSLDEIRKGKL